MFRQRRQRDAITFIFHIFIIQCLLLDGLLCYQYGGNSNPPSPRQDNDDVIRDVTHEPYKPSSLRQRNKAEDATESEQDNTMPSHYNGAWDETVNKRTLQQQHKPYVKTENGVIPDHQPHPYPDHYHRPYHQTGAPSPAGKRRKGRRGRRKNPPYNLSITATTSTSTVPYYHHRNLHPYRTGVGSDKMKRNKKSVRDVGRRYKTLSMSKDFRVHQSVPTVHKLQDKDKSSRGLNRYEKLTDIHELSPPSYAHQPSLHAVPATAHTPPYLYQSNQVPNEDWEKLLKIDSVNLPESRRTGSSAARPDNNKPLQGSFDRPQLQKSNKPSPPRAPDNFRPRGPWGDGPQNSDDMYQADEPDSEHLEAYIEALHHIEEMSACSAVRCKDPQPFVQRMQDPDKPNLLFIPKCTILHRCMNFSGCCGDRTRECVPRKTMVIRKAFVVIDISYLPSGFISYGPNDAQMIEMVNHTECECREKPRPNSCSKRCPVPFNVLKRSIDCECHCLQHSREDRRKCEDLKDGLVPLSTDGLVCIKEGNCNIPPCIHGDFDVKTGFCPLADQSYMPAHASDNQEDRRHDRKHLARQNPRNNSKKSTKSSTDGKIIVAKNNTPKKTKAKKEFHSKTVKKKISHQEKKTSLKLRKVKPTKKSVVTSHPESNSIPKNHHKKVPIKPKKHHTKNSKRTKKFKHGKSFYALDFMKKNTSPNKEYAFGPNSGPKKRTAHGAPYNFKKGRKMKTKSISNSTTAQSSLGPEPLTMPQTGKIPPLYQNLTYSPSSKPSDVTATLLPHSKSTPTKTFTKRSKSTLPTSSTTASMPQSSNHNPNSTILNTLTTTENTESTFAKTENPSTDYLQHEINSNVSNPSNNNVVMSTSEQPPVYFNASKPHTITSSSSPKSSNPNRKVSTSKKAPSPFTISSQTTTTSKTSFYNSKNLEKFDDKENLPEKGLSSDYTMISTEDTIKSMEKDDFADYMAEEDALDAESLPTEGSGSDTEN